MVDDEPLEEKEPALQPFKGRPAPAGGDRRGPWAEEAGLERCLHLPLAGQQVQAVERGGAPGGHIARVAVVTARLLIRPLTGACHGVTPACRRSLSLAGATRGRPAWWRAALRGGRRSRERPPPCPRRACRRGLRPTGSWRSSASASCRRAPPG